MGVFSAGDIFVFILSVLVCVFFYLMGNSKRLEKVKKYGEKLMGEMKELADSAKVPLENFKIDLAVEVKAAEQLLLRLKDVRATVAEYGDNLKHIEERFEQFNVLLSGLDRESAAVEENLLRIRDESAFVDGVSVKIAAARKRFDSLERELGHLKESMLGAFEKTNAEKLEKSAAFLLETTKETAVSLQSEIEQKIETLTQTVDTLNESVESRLDSLRKAKEEQEALVETSRQEVSRLAEDAVKKAGERSAEYENQLFQQLREETDEKARAAREKIENEWTAIQKASEENHAVIAALSQESRDAIAAIGEEIENAKAGIRDTIVRTAEEEEALWQGKLDAIKNEFDLFSRHAAELEERVKTIQEQIGNNAEKIETTIREALENAEKLGEEKFDIYRAALEEKLNGAKNEFDLFSRHAAELEERLKTMQEQIGSDAGRIETTLHESFENAARYAAENAEKLGNEKFDIYRAALEEKLSAFSAASDEKLHEANKSLSNMIGSLNELMQNTGNEINESVAVIKEGTDKAKSDIESLTAEFETLKKEAEANLSGKISLLEDSMAVSLNEKIESLKSMQETEYAKFDSEIAEKYRTASEETGRKWSDEFERLKEKLGMFENTLRLEMDAAGENLGIYKDSIEQNWEDLRKNTELLLKNEIGKITLETNEVLRSRQREFEDSLRSLSADVKKRIEGTQVFIEETSVKSDEALQAANENMETTAQKIAALNAEIQNAQKKMADFSEQTKLFEQADNLKVELERKIEDMEADIERLTQEKNVLAGMEMQFGKIRRMEEEMNAKMTRFLAEQKRIDIMESDFNRLVKMSGDIEDKLQSISAENEMLEQVQVKLRKLYEAADASEEKYQRVEKRNNIIETTNAGISANFKRLEDAERRIESYKADVVNIEKEISGVKDALAKIKFENSEALEISKALSTLDTSLAEIEERIEKMQTAREWLAEIETRMTEMHRNTMETISRIDEKTKRSLGGGSHGKIDVLSPSIQDDVRRLKHDGWNVEDIAKNYGMSVGEVRLILEGTPP